MKYTSAIFALGVGVVTVQGFTFQNSPLSVKPLTPQSTTSVFQSVSKLGKERKIRPLFSTKQNDGKRSIALSRFRLNTNLRIIGRIRSSLAIVAASFLVWLASAGISTQSAHASATAPLAKQTASAASSSSLSKMVDRYVKDHMFDDDVYEPVESIYREAISDQVKGSHPKALSEITSAVLGQDGMKVEKASSASGVGEKLMGAVNFLQRKGLSESTAVIVLTGTFVVAGPAVFLLGAMMVGSQSKRQINSVMKKRYGDTYTVDATVKVEDDVEIEDDDDDDNDDDDDDDAEDDEDDE